MANTAARNATTAILNPGEDDELTCKGFKRNRVKVIFAHLFSVLLLGIPYLIGHWKPKWTITWFRSSSPLLNADSVLIEDGVSGDSAIVKIENVPVSEESFPQHYLHKIGLHGEPIDESEANDMTRLWTPTQTTFRFFFYKSAKYVWNSEEKTFERLANFDQGEKLSRFSSDLRSGLSDERRSSLRLLYGLNIIDVEVKSYLVLLFQEVLNPFYIFQIASMILWTIDSYFYYASCIFIISAVSIVISLIETRRQSIALHNMVAASNDLTVTVYKGQDKFEEVPSASLVPGDVVVVPTGNKLMACDAILLAGSCIVNEALLTGESIPVTKSPLPYDENSDEVYDSEKHKKHTLFAGTSVIQTRSYGPSMALAVVARTGFSTAKGELIRSIMFPKPIGFKFYQDAIRFIVVLFLVAVIGMMYCIYVFVARSAPVERIILRSLDIITIVVPPALPAAMTIGIYHAQNRLKKAGIFCISPQRINVCGKLKLVCFDKTGTLTEEGLDMWGVVGVKNHSDAVDGDQITDTNFIEAETNVEKIDTRNQLKKCLASCHSLTMIDEVLIGDPLDIKMFESTGWELNEPGGNSFDGIMVSIVKPKDLSDSDELDYSALDAILEIGIIKQFDFSASLARMSVIARGLSDNFFTVYTKGAPERIEDLCVRESIPVDFHEMLKKYTLAGFRVIGLAYRKLPAEINWVKADKMKRAEVEQNLIFLGFLIMQNTLKPQTTPVIAELKKSRIRCVMITGDNILTALSVARDCQIIDRNDQIIVVEASLEDEIRPTIKFLPTDDSLHADSVVSLSSDSEGDAENGRLLPQNYHFAMSGSTWSVIRSHYEHLLPKLITRGTVFARMAPEQKGQLVEEFQKLDFIVSFCGDGANDICALKLSHVGISLSEAEASIAAPFTSKVPDIRCVPIVIREGRCSLVTSFGIFKYMALYSMVQFISVLILYTMYTNLGDTQFLYIDLAITTTVAVLMGWTKAYSELAPKQPPGSLISGPNLFSIFSQIIITTVIQVGGYLYLKSMPWFKPLVLHYEEWILSWENTTIFIVSSFQYLILACVFSKGRPYRKPFYSNIPFLVSVIVLAVFSLVLSIYPGQNLAYFFELMFDPLEPRFNFRLVLLALTVLNVVASYLVEAVIADSKYLKRICNIIARKKGPKYKYKGIQQEMKEENWPNFVLSGHQSSLHLRHPTD